MIPFETIGLTPTGAGTPSSEIRACLEALVEGLRESGRSAGTVLALTLFVDAGDAEAYRTCREETLDLVERVLGRPAPPASVVAQAPEGGRHVALEAAVLLPGAEARVERREVDGLPYSVVTENGVRQVHGAGLASIRGRDDPAGQAREAFEAMEAVLDREALTFGHVVRQWGYIEDMLDVGSTEDGGQQGYQAFNDVRTIAYARSAFPAGYPAATGIGQAAGGIVLEFLALDAPDDVVVAPISNPKQVDAHRYSEGVLVGESLEDLSGKSPPKFERAKRVARGDESVVFVSGTASIRGEESVAVGDVAAQTRTTIDNIAALVEGRPLSRLRAYVKLSEDIPVVRSVCEDAYGTIPALYVRADVCREELLVELEGAVVSRPSRSGETEVRR